MPPATLTTLEVGSLWRYPMRVDAKTPPPPSYLTDRIEGGGARVGTVLVRVLGVCQRGCHVNLRVPIRKQEMREEKMSSAKLEPIRAGDAALAKEIGL